MSHKTEAYLLFVAVIIVGVIDGALGVSYSRDHRDVMAVFCYAQMMWMAYLATGLGCDLWEDR